MNPTLAERLKQATQPLHTQAERAGLMGELLAGRIERRQYTTLLHHLHALYLALEQALAGWSDAPASWQALWLRLQRSAALRADLAALQGDDTAPGVLAPSLREYVQRLADTPPAQAHRLLAHAYVRYLGDLHGGQILARQVRRCFALAGDDGTRFYDFGSADEVQQLRQQLRTLLASAALTPQAQDEVVAEAVWAFATHVRLFEELASAAQAA